MRIKAERAAGGLLVYYKLELEKDVEFLKSQSCEDILSGNTRE